MNFSARLSNWRFMKNLREIRCTNSIKILRPFSSSQVFHCQVKLEEPQEKILGLKPLKGFKDYGPLQMFLMRKIFSKIEGVFKMHGAVEIKTPTLEKKDILMGKYGEEEKLIYHLEKETDESLSLIYDLTIPFARYVACNNLGSFKRYSITRAYRKDYPSIIKGRYREFYQCDFDISGLSAPMVPDAECLKVIHQVLQKLDLGPFTIKVNHRKVLDAIFEVCGVPEEKYRTICSAVDKMDKVPWNEVKHEMVEEKGLKPEIADLIGTYVKQSGGKDLLELLKEDQNLKQSTKFLEGIDELLLLHKYCKCLGCDNQIRYDMSLARGLSCYTGSIFEAILHDSTESIGSVAGGGRYDNLVSSIDPKGRSVPCVGVSFGVERLYPIFKKHFEAKSPQISISETKVYVVSAGKQLLCERLELIAELYSKGIPAETSPKSKPKVLDQFQYAEEKGIPYILLIGPSELENGTVVLRETNNRLEEILPRDQCLMELYNRLSKK